MSLDPGLGVGTAAIEIGRRPGRGRLSSPLTLFCVLYLTFIVVCVLVGSQIAPHSASAQDLANTYAAPSRGHLLGTDALGRDIFSRVIVGARLAMIGPLVIALGAMLIGNVLGTIAGYYGSRIDFVIMRWADLVFSLPGLLVAIVVVGVLGGGYWLAVTTLMLLTAPSDTRLVRAAVAEQRPRPYVEAVQALGVRPVRIMFANIWPNVLPVVVANTFLNFAYSLVGLAGLSFLGLGSGPAAPDWGLMIADNRQFLFQAPLSVLGPSAFLVLLAWSMTHLGDSAFEQLSDRGRTR